MVTSFFTSYLIGAKIQERSLEDYRTVHLPTSHQRMKCLRSIMCHRLKNHQPFTEKDDERPFPISKLGILNRPKRSPKLG